MTLLGNAFIAALSDSGNFDILPFQQRGRTPVIEVYPGHAMWALNVRNYKRRPADCIDEITSYLHANDISLNLDPTVRQICETYNTSSGTSSDYDAADAFVCAAMAVLFREGLARPMEVRLPCRIRKG